MIIPHWRYAPRKRFVGTKRVHQEYPNRYVQHELCLDYAQQKKFIKRRARDLAQLVQQGKMTKIESLCWLRSHYKLSLKIAKNLIEGV